MKKKLFTLLMCGTVFGLAACGSQKTEESSDTASAPQEAEEALRRYVDQREEAV